MKPGQIKNAFAHIASEASKDELLSQAIAGRISAEQSLVPVNELKALFRQFMAIILPAVILYFALSAVQIESVISFPDMESAIEHNSVVVRNSIDFATNSWLITMWFIRGVLRGFILLAVFTFILTAAAMPVSRSNETTGGSPCVA